jgi:hypothetical protein
MNIIFILIKMPHIIFIFLLLSNFIFSADQSLKKEQTDYLLNAALQTSVDIKVFNGGTKKSKELGITKTTFTNLSQVNASKLRFDIIRQLLLMNPSADFSRLTIPSSPFEASFAYAFYKGFTKVSDEDDLLVPEIEHFISSRFPPSSQDHLLQWTISKHKLIAMSLNDHEAFFLLFKNNTYNHQHLFCIDAFLAAVIRVLLNGCCQHREAAINTENAKQSFLIAHKTVKIGLFLLDLIKKIKDQHFQNIYLKYYPLIYCLISDSYDVLGHIEERDEYLKKGGGYDAVPEILKDFMPKITQKNSFYSLLQSARDAKFNLGIDAMIYFIHFETLIKALLDLPAPIPHLQEIIKLIDDQLSVEFITSIFDEKKEKPISALGVLYIQIFNAKNFIKNVVFLSLKEKLSKALLTSNNNNECLIWAERFQLEIVKAFLIKFGAHISPIERIGGKITITIFDHNHIELSVPHLVEMKQLELEESPDYLRLQAEQRRTEENKLHHYLKRLQQLEIAYKASLGLEDSNQRKMVAPQRTGKREEDLSDDEKSSEIAVLKPSFMEIINEAERNAKQPMDELTKIFFDTFNISFEEAEGCRIKATLKRYGYPTHAFTFHGRHGENALNLSSLRKEEMKRICFEQWKIITQKEDPVR